MDAESHHTTDTPLTNAVAHPDPSRNLNGKCQDTEFVSSGERRHAPRAAVKRSKDDWYGCNRSETADYAWYWGGESSGTPGHKIKTMSLLGLEDETMIMYKHGVFLGQSAVRRTGSTWPKER